jgi:hypothetical protein
MNQVTSFVYSVTPTKVKFHKNRLIKSFLFNLKFYLQTLKFYLDEGKISKILKLKPSFALLEINF